MTDQLSRMLRETGADVAVPTPPAHDVLADGRRLRRRRTAGGVAGAGAAAALVLTGALLVPGLGQDRAVDPVAPPAAPTFEGVTWADGDEVFLDGGDQVVRIDGGVVKRLYYSSAGVVVSSGPEGVTTARRFTLVRPDGTTRPIPFRTSPTEEYPGGLDPEEPFMAWTEEAPRTGAVEVVVHDLEADTEVARVPLPGDFAWSPPPVDLDGDTVYVGGSTDASPGLLAVDWRTGEVRATGLDTDYPVVSGGHVVDTASVTTTRVLDAATGDVVLDEELPGITALSPDGAHLVDADPVGDEPRSVAIDLGTGREVELTTALTAIPFGWSALSQPYSLDDDRLTVCSPATGECLTREVDLGGRQPDVMGDVNY